MELNNSLGYLLNVAARFMKQKLDNSLKRYDITTSQWAVLKILYDKGEMTQVEIARFMHSDKATCGTMLEKLIRKGLIEKKTSLMDKRAYVISLTEQSYNIMPGITEEASACNKLVESEFSESEIQKIKIFLNSIINKLGEED